MIGRLVDVADRWGSHAVAHRRPPAVDRITDAAAWANGMPIWVGVSAVLASSGRRGRVVAARALVSYATASAASNVVVKHVVTRRRPWSARPRGAVKTTSAFPSSHATTASAFSVAVTLDWPTAGLPALLLASVVSGSRVYARQHRIGDVAGGVAVGAMVATALHCSLPGRPTATALVRAHEDDAERP